MYEQFSCLLYSFVSLTPKTCTEQNWEHRGNKLAVIRSKGNGKVVNPVSLKQCSALQFPKQKLNPVNVSWSWHKILDPGPLLFISLVIGSSASIHCPFTLDSTKVLAISQALPASRDWECKSSQLYFTNTKLGSLRTYFISVVTLFCFKRSL